MLISQLYVLDLPVHPVLNPVTLTFVLYGDPELHVYQLPLAAHSYLRNKIKTSAPQLSSHILSTYSKCHRLDYKEPQHSGTPSADQVNGGTQLATYPTKKDHSS